MKALSSYLRSLDPRLPRSVWTLQAGGLANSVGNGIVLPFTVIYLHNVRGFSLGTSGLVVSLLFGTGIVSGPIAGIAVDRLGGRITLACALVLLAAGYGGFPLIRETWHAFALAPLAGAGNGAFWPAQSTLLAGLTPQARRHAAYAVQRVTSNLGIGIGGVIGGLIATTAHPGSFTVLYVLDAVTFFLYAGVLALVPSPEPVEEGGAPAAGRYREVVRDRVFIGAIALNALFVSVSYGQFDATVPAFAKNHAGVSETGIGILYLANTLLIVLAQLPIAKLNEGRRRMPALALMGVLWAAAWLIVLGAGTFRATIAVLVFALAAAVFALGECLHGAVQGPLVADLAPPRLIGRYMALSSLSWQVGMGAGPAIGGFLLAASPSGLWLFAATVCLTASVAALALERGIPRHVRRTPGEAAALAAAEA